LSQGHPWSHVLLVVVRHCELIPLTGIPWVIESKCESDRNHKCWFNSILVEFTNIYYIPRLEQLPWYFKEYTHFTYNVLISHTKKSWNSKRFKWLTQSHMQLVNGRFPWIYSLKKYTIATTFTVIIC
jgi:hypothetical protein